MSLRNESYDTIFLSFISSPEIVLAYSLAGKLSFNLLTDPVEGADGEFMLEPPKPAPEIPADGFVFKAEGYLAPPADRSAIDVCWKYLTESLSRSAP